MVHASRGRLRPRVGAAAVGGRRSCAGLARRGARRPATAVPWEDFAKDYDAIRDRDRAGRPRLRGLQRARARAPAGSRCRTRRATAPLPHRHGQGQLHGQPARAAPTVPEGRLLLQTMRSHDQYNTTIYGLDDRYRGITRRPPGGASSTRRTCAALGLADGRTSTWSASGRTASSGAPPASGSSRYPTARGLRRRLLSRRPTCSSRWTAPPRGRTRPPRSRSWCGSNRTAVRWRLVERFRIQVFSLLSGWESGPWVTAKADAGQRHGWPVPATMRLCGASGASHLERRRTGQSHPAGRTMMSTTAVQPIGSTPWKSASSRSSSGCHALAVGAPYGSVCGPGTIATSCPCGLWTAPLETPLISRDAALAGFRA